MPITPDDLTAILADVCETLMEHELSQEQVQGIAEALPWEYAVRLQSAALAKAKGA